MHVVPAKFRNSLTMNNRTLAIVSYITLIGWLIAYFQYKGNNEKSPLVRYHLGQSLGIIIISFVLGIAVGIVTSLIPALGSILSLVGIVPLALLVIGAITASKEESKPVPVVGNLFEGKFSFL